MITISKDEDGQWVVWTDCDDHKFSGRCLAVEPTKLAALKEAQRVIRSDATQITKALNAERKGNPS